MRRQGWTGRAVAAGGAALALVLGLPGTGLGGHRHGWEHVVVWVPQDEPERAAYVATSAHGGFDVHPRDEIQWDGTHPKTVYHKDGIGTHCFRPAGTGDEPPEIHAGTRQYPTLAGWERYPAGVREQLVAAGFGSAAFGLSGAAFGSRLERRCPRTSRSARTASRAAAGRRRLTAGSGGSGRRTIPRIAHVSELPPDPARLRVLAAWLQLQLNAVRGALAEAERRQAQEAARPGWWVQWRRRVPGQPRGGVLHRRGCWCPGEPDLRAEEVRRLLAEHGDRIERCAACRPDIGAG